MRRVVEARAQQQELVSAEAADRVIGAKHAPQAVGDAAEQVVADGVSERVVDALEVIDVEEQHRGQAAVPAPPGGGVAEPVEEQRAVRQAGQAVVEALVCEVRRCAFALTHAGQLDRATQRRAPHDEQSQQPKDAGREQQPRGRARARQRCVESAAGSEEHDAPGRPGNGRGRHVVVAGARQTGAEALPGRRSQKPAMAVDQERSRAGKRGRGREVAGHEVLDDRRVRTADDDAPPVAPGLEGDRELDQGLFRVGPQQVRVGGVPGERTANVVTDGADEPARHRGEDVPARVEHHRQRVGVGRLVGAQRGLQ